MQKKKRRGIAEGDERPSGGGACVLIGVLMKPEKVLYLLLLPRGLYPRLV